VVIPELERGELYLVSVVRQQPAGRLPEEPLSRPPSPTLTLAPARRRALAALVPALWVPALWVPALLVSGQAAGQTPGIEVADLGGLETRSAALILSGQEAGALRTSVLAVPVPDPAADGKVRVVLVIDVDGPSLLEGAAEDALVAEVYAYAVDGGGGLGGVLNQAFRIDLARHRATIAASGVKFLGHLDLAPGDYSLRTLVLHRHADRMRLAVESLTVQPLRPRHLLPPLFPQAVEGRIVVRENSAVELPFPRVTDGRSWAPAARPQVAGESGFYLAGRGLAGGLRAHVVDDRGEVLSELGLGDLRPVDDPPRGLEMVAAAIRTTGIAGGSRRLRIAFADGAAATSIPLAIPLSEAELAVGTELDEPALESIAESGRSVAVARGQGLTRLLDRARAAYVEALGHLSAGDGSKALTSIIALERAGIGERLNDDTAAVEEQLRTAQASAAVQLAGEQAEGLVPLISLHEQLFRQYYKYRHFFLAGHTRQVLAALAAVYLERSRSPEAARLVADAMASIGGFLQELGARPAAKEAYRQALDYAPGHPTALLASAMLDEEVGEYSSAANLLRQLVSEDPGDREAKLRLAVNSRRLDTLRRARRLLEECIAGDPPDWITALAYQELAALQIAENRPEEAVAVLKKALERMPDQQAAYLQLAALYDRTGRPSEATAILHRLDARSAAGAASPRLLYSQSPAGYVNHSRQELESRALARLPELVERASRFAAADEPGAASPGPGPP
jgi:tetratricopeptide (TPR) repeat protein